MPQIFTEYLLLLVTTVPGVELPDQPFPAPQSRWKKRSPGDRTLSPGEGGQGDIGSEDGRGLSNYRHMYNNSPSVKLFSYVSTIPTFSYPCEHLQYIRYLEFICALICPSEKVQFLSNFPILFFLS